VQQQLVVHSPLLQTVVPVPAVGLLQLAVRVELVELVELEAMAEPEAAVPVTAQRPLQLLPSLGIYILEQLVPMDLQQLLLVLQQITVVAVAVV
jgi:hypothetical protein